MGSGVKQAIYVISTVAVILLLHNAQFIFASFYDRAEGDELTPFVYKPPFSLSEDNLSYAGIIRYSGNHPSIYRYDPLIKENGHLSFADGNIINSYLGLFHKIFNNINYTYYFGAFLPLILSVILVFKIVKLFYSNYTIPISIAVAIVISCASFDDFFGLKKFILGYIFTEDYGNNIIIHGYAQRFPYCQSTTFILLFWIYRFILYRRNPDLKNQILLALSLLALQYGYFFYWSYGLAITFSMILFDRRRLKEFIPLLISYIIFTAHFWFEFYEFNQLPFLEEYRERIKGIEFYPDLPVVIVGSVCLLPFLKFSQKSYVLLAIAIPIISSLSIEFAYYTFQPFHYAYIGIQVFTILAIAGLVLFVWFKKDWKNWQLITLVNYYLMFVLCNLKFYLGFNVQPYHWVYAAYYPFLIINVLVILKNLVSTQIVKKVTIGFATLTVILGLSNSFKMAEKVHGFWTIQKDDVAVIDFLKQRPYTVIAGNNMMPLITFTAHADVYLYEGSTSHKRSMYDESAARFIQPYKIMGYSDSLIVAEYTKYRDLVDLNIIFGGKESFERDSLANVYPDNSMGSVEVMWCYFMFPENYLGKFKESLSNFVPPSYEMNHLIIYKPTFRGNYDVIEGNVVLENETYKIYETPQLTN